MLKRIIKAVCIASGILALLFALQFVAGDVDKSLARIREANLKSIADLRLSVLANTRDAMPSSGSQADPDASADLYEVTDVVDGDTVKVTAKNAQTGALPKPVTLRLIGMDTPEVVDPRKPVQCFGREASAEAKKILAGQEVVVEFDQTQGMTDKYGRTLAYVYVHGGPHDGLFFNEHMIEEGYAFEYTYRTPYKYQAEFKQAQKDAQQNGRGLWFETTCDGVASNVSK